MGNDVATQGKRSLVEKMAERFHVDHEKFMVTLKSTAFKQRDGSAPSNEQMMALMVVADQYKLNPFTKEIYAFPDKQNGIIPVVGVDGWSRIINSHPQFDGMEFRYSENMVDSLKGMTHAAPEWCECVMYRKDRTHPIVVREYLDEVYRPPFKDGMSGPWQTHTRRFHRHKSMIQASRIAFGFVGIYDEDEAERIVEAKERDMGPAERVDPARPSLPEYPQADFESNLPAWRSAIASGKRTADQIIAMVGTKGVLSKEQKQAIRDCNVNTETGEVIEGEIQ